MQHAATPGKNEKRPPAKDPPIHKGPLREPMPEPPRRDPPPRGPDGEPKEIEDPKAPGQPAEIKVT